MANSGHINIIVLIHLVSLLSKGRIELSPSTNLLGLLLRFQLLERNHLCRLGLVSLEFHCFHTLRSRSLLGMVNGFLSFNVGQYNVKRQHCLLISN